MDRKIKKAFITGITGYIGSKLVKKLLESGTEVYGLIRNNSNFKNLQAFIDKITLISIDDENALKKLLNSDIDIIYHLASKQKFEQTIADVDEILDVNIKLGVNILEKIKNNSNIVFVNATTYWTHSDGIYCPVNLYSATKQAFIDILIYYSQAYEIPSISLKLYDVYGLDDPRNKILNILLKAFEKDEEVLLTQGEQEIDLVHIDDVVNGFLIAGEYLLNIADRKFNHVYGLATKKPIKIKDLVNLINKYSPKQLKVRLGAIPYRKRQIFKIIYTDENLPFWKPTIFIEDFLKNLWGK